MRAPITLAVAALLCAVAGGCSDGDGTDAVDRLAGRDLASPSAEPSSRPSAVPSTDVVEMRPGAPGEPSQVANGGPASRWNHDDIAFVQMMIPHHAQALEMAELARTRAESSAVLAAAERIEAAQAPEILLMSSWLVEQNVQVPKAGDDMSEYDHAQHGHHGMVGMLTPAQLDDLAAAQGADFDRLFLAGMIAHHEGAVQMALDVLAAGEDVRVNELAADVNAGQSAEIGRLERLLAAL